MKRNYQAYTPNVTAYAAHMSAKSNSSKPRGTIQRQRCTLTGCLRSVPREGAQCGPPADMPHICFVPFFARVTNITGTIERNKLGDIDYRLPFTKKIRNTGHIHLEGLSTLFVKQECSMS